MTTACEVNFDGLIGPTHNYCTLSWGNRASMDNCGQPSDPKAAALQGLAKMKRLHELGMPQGVLPPLPRPIFAPLRQRGFTGSDVDMLKAASEADPELLAACWSASAMWAANSATVTPSSDSGDRKVHFTPANLVSKFHRALEVDQTAALLRRIFAGRSFRHHAPVPRTDFFADEGAANHCRLCLDHGGPGVHLFVHGRDAVTAAPRPHRFPARHTRQASKAVCRQNRLSTGQVVLAQQNPEAIDAGVFHNDVIATSHRDIFFYHERAYVNTPGVVQRLCQTFTALTGGTLRLINVGAREIPVELAVSSYLFNSQLVTAPDGRTILVAPRECQRIPRVRTYLDALMSRSACPIDSVEFVEVNQSMRGGGGPACLRLRVPLTAAQLRSLDGNVLLTDALYERLVHTVNETYPESVSFADLSNDNFLETCRNATARIYAVLNLV